MPTPDRTIARRDRRRGPRRCSRPAARPRITMRPSRAASVCARRRSTSASATATPSSCSSPRRPRTSSPSGSRHADSLARRLCPRVPCVRARTPRRRSGSCSRRPARPWRCSVPWHRSSLRPRTSWARERALDAARLFTAWATGFLNMELAGSFRMGGDVDEAFEFGLATIQAGLEAQASRSGQVLPAHGS